MALVPQQQPHYHGKLAVLCESLDSMAACRQLADTLAIPLQQTHELNPAPENFWLAWRDGCLKLLDFEHLKKGGLYVEVEPRPGEQRSWPAPKDGSLAKALGRKTKTVVDATTGWGQDSLHIFRMGYQLTCMERSPVMAALLADGFNRLAQLDWMQRLKLVPPALSTGNAIELLSRLPQPPDCIYLDPMFPPKRKKSALAKKSMLVLRDLLGDDEDKDKLFEAAMQTAGKRVVVKSPDYAEPLGGKPHESFQGKLLRYDVYLR
ncbi:MAG: hypothetical protein CTY18_00025 [Methylomonas sp.]|nr:MAG: hypothetical protein CTY24_03970 [Methylobacter sp.]PPD37351.1 MAG: hypothetical protein CTY18_00025 [Methylomonas sp.]